MSTARRRLQQAIDGLLRASEAAEALGPSSLADFDPDVQVSDDEWLAAVVICLSDGWNNNMDAALDVVLTNRAPCLTARTLGIEPWEMAQFIQMNTTP